MANDSFKLFFPDIPIKNLLQDRCTFFFRQFFVIEIIRIQYKAMVFLGIMQCSNELERCFGMISTRHFQVLSLQDMYK